MGSQWIQLEPLLQEKRHKPSIGSVQGNIVIGGGVDGDIMGDNTASSTVFMWVEASSEWENVTSLKIPRYNHATVQLPKGDIGLQLLPKNQNLQLLQTEYHLQITDN